VEGDPDQSDIDLMKDAKVWTRGTAGNRKLGQPGKGFTEEDYDKMKDMTGEEQLRYMNQVFNFYAMDEPLEMPTAPLDKTASILPPIQDPKNRTRTDISDAK